MVNLVYREVGSNLIIVLDFDAPIEISQTNPNYQTVIDLIDGRMYLADDEADLVRELSSPKKRVEKFLSGSNQLTIEHGQILWNGTPLHGVLVERILKAMDIKDANANPLINFLIKLQQNPSFRAREQLFGFLDAGGNVITPDGDFLAYKKVRDNYYDIHSGQYRNKPGDTPRMPRSEVDDDPNRTCSKGLHVCSYKYLDQFGSGSRDTDRTVVCKVNPADVVAIPADYNDTKMRTCGYVVVSEIKSTDRKDYLGTREMWYDDVQPDNNPWDESTSYASDDDWISSSDNC